MNISRKKKRLCAPAAFLFIFFAASWLAAPKAWAIPSFSLTHNLRCTACHSVVPKLNAYGLAYAQRGYRLPGGFDLPPGAQFQDKLGTQAARTANSIAPISPWLTGRHEHGQMTANYLKKVELISGAAVGERFSYFVEWLPLSQQTRGDGSLRDRSGRFEDAYVNWHFDQGSWFRIGQYRPLQQLNVSQRLSVSTPALLGASLAGDPSADGRIQSLRRFSPAGRSPGMTLLYRSIRGCSSSDGLFHNVSVPFVGEFSFPLTGEAQDEAGFELREAKGVFLETFYRWNVNSVGLHAFVDDDRWLLTGVAALNYRNWYLTAGIGTDDQQSSASRTRYSLEVEYLWKRCFCDEFRPGFGFRVEQVIGAGREPAYIPYFILAGPNGPTGLLQIEYRGQDGSETLFLDYSLML